MNEQPHQHFALGLTYNVVYNSYTKTTDLL